MVDAAAKIFIRGESIRLGQFLKLADAVATGGEAKLRIQHGEVRVNGAVDIRRGRQLRPGDSVEISGRLYMVVGR